MYQDVYQDDLQLNISLQYIRPTCTVRYINLINKMGKKNRKQKKLKMKDLEGIRNKEEFMKGLKEISKTERGRESISLCQHISSFMMFLIEDYDKFIKFRHRVCDIYNIFRDMIIDLVKRDGGDQRHVDYLSSWRNYGKSWALVY